MLMLDCQSQDQPRAATSQKILTVVARGRNHGQVQIGKSHTKLPGGVVPGDHLNKVSSLSYKTQHKD